MILYPAIELKHGAVVRLKREDEDVLLQNVNPLEEAAALADAGCRWLHVDDQDLRVSGAMSNREIIAAIRDRTGLRLQLSGVSPTAEAVEQWLELGVDRLVLDAGALRPPTLKALCGAHPGRIAVTLFSRAGRVAIEGWSSRVNPRPLDVALRIEDAGAAAILFATADADGRLVEMDVDQTADLAFTLHMPVISAGPVTALADLESIKAEEGAGIEGIIVGRALHDGRVPVAEALRLLED